MTLGHKGGYYHLQAIVSKEKTILGITTTTTTNNDDDDNGTFIAHTNMWIWSHALYRNYLPIVQLSNAYCKKINWTIASLLFQFLLNFTD